VKKRFNAGQIISFLRKVDAGMPVKELCRIRSPRKYSGKCLGG